MILKKREKLMQLSSKWTHRRKTKREKIQYRCLAFMVAGGFFHFWPFKFTERLSLLRDENVISLNRSNGVSKRPSFQTDFKNVQMTLVNSAPKNVFPKKLFYQIKIWPKKLFFWGANFIWVHFLQKVICKFLKSVRKDGFFYTSFDLIKEKKFSSHSRVRLYFNELESPNGSNIQYFGKRFFTNRS